MTVRDQVSLRWASGERGPLGVYVHVPFCATRCGYCDFNTYTREELGAGVSRETFAATLRQEIRLAAEVLDGRSEPVDTVFFGGGTPTLLPPEHLVGILHEVAGSLGLAPDAEVTVEANPDSVDPALLATLRSGGVNRMSFGVQSLAPDVLRVLDRTHTPGRGVRALEEAREAGFEHLSADLIYGTPGETDDDVKRSAEEVLATGIDHLSAYALIVETGTRLAGDVRRGLIPRPDDDAMADRYLLVDSLAEQAGLHWYEISNWAVPGGQCRHNLRYWRDADWWGAGPGAHGHLRGVRWWNRKHPAAYAERIAQGELPVEDFEVPDDAARRLERLMLGLRLREGIDADLPVNADAVAEMTQAGLLDRDGSRLTLTLSGRLLADRVVRRLSDEL